MDRLQLYISKSLRGFKTLVNINGSEMTRRHLRDLRPALETVAYDSTEKCVFYLIQYIDGGTALSVLRTIPDQPLDHLSATLVIPDGLEIDAAGLYAIVREITRKVSNPGMSSDDVAGLRQLLTTEYPVDQRQAARVPSEGRTFAARYYNGSTGLKLIDFLGDKLYQPDDIAYAGVLLVDADLPFKIQGHDISYQPLSRVVTLLPPKRVPSFTPHIFHRVFDKPYQVALGSTVDIVWQRPGFEDVIQQVTVTADSQQPDVPATAETRKTISRSSFYITSQTSNDRLPDCTIKVNGMEISEPMPFTQSELADAEVEISAPGYHSYRGRLDLASTSQALIELIPEGKSKNRRKAAESPEDTTVEIKSDRRSTDPVTHRRKGMPWWQKGLFVLVGIAVALGLCYLLMPDLFGVSADDKAAPTPAPANSIAASKMHVEQESSTDTTPVISGQTAAADPNTPQQPAATQPAGESQPAAGQPAASGDNLAAAVKYIDSNAYWRESEVAGNPLLKAFYHDLLNFNLNALANDWPKKIPGSKWVEKVSTHARAAIGKKLDPKAAGPTYKKSGAGQIHRQEYVNWIDRRQG